MPVIILGLAVLLALGIVLQRLSDPAAPVWEPVTATLGRLISGVSGSENILLIGNNARSATSPLSPGQADILMVVHVDPAARTVTLISIPRNVLFAYPGWRDPIPKIKGAFFLGANETPNRGPQMAVQAVSKLTGLPINGYVVTDFQGFVDAINAVGGITVDVPARLYDPKNSGANLYPGVQRLDGAQALAYVRIRQNEAGNGVRVNDFQRMDAEAQVLAGLKRALLNPATAPTTVPRLVAVWQRDVVTNLNRSQLVGLLIGAAGDHFHHLTLGALRDSMILASAPLPGVNAEGAIEGAYYDILDPAHIEAELAPLGGGPASTGLPPLPAPASVPVEVSGSASLISRLKAAGFPLTAQVTAGGGHITVYYPPGEPAAGWAVARAVAASNEYVVPGSSARVVVVDN